MNLKIVTTLLNLFLFLTIKNPHFHPHFSLESTFAEGLQCKYKFYKQVLCHPANSKSVFFISVNIQKTTSTLNLSTNPI